MGVFETVVQQIGNPIWSIQRNDDIKPTALFPKNDF